MYPSSRKRRAETLIINQENEPDETQEEVQEEDPQMIDTIPDLPTHIVFDILSRLPIKTLFNCRRVCKDWLSLISDPHFAKLHLSRSQVCLLVKPITERYQSRKLNLVDLRIATYARPRESRIKLVPKINLPKDPKIAFNIVNSCNGFLCLSEPVTDDPIYVCNPILGEYITLPKCSSGKTVSSCAFGFSPVTDQYKVIRSFCNGDHHEVEIYTLGEGFWRNIGNDPYGVKPRFYSSFDTFVSGSLHWFAFHYRNPDLINCFDFTSEQFRAVPGPSRFCGSQKEYMRLGVLQGCLSICDFSDGDHVDIWLMKDYGVKQSWSKDFYIVKMINETEIYDYYEPIMVLEGGLILMLVNEDSLLVYDPGLEHYEDVHIYGIASMFRGIAHVPNLVSLGDVALGENLKRKHLGSWFLTCLARKLLDLMLSGHEE
ncbi:hypothetical protein RHGRI_009875 [Rhododendron griersonianum]|uniref:F-box domain-containing protein n=1 Tax=Rhododendron griersonianum TaxID=479676 RepID=A0AAV6KGP1_9ERIC|nr:hypothetical protein RHGRI_009875 [Rhododendron griersonianum]